MATVKYAISTSNKAGYAATYSTLSACFAAIQTNYPDFVAATTNVIVDCFNDWGTAGLTDNLYITGINTSSTYDLTIQTPLSERHTGIPNTGFKVTSTANWNPTIRVGNSGIWCNFIGLESTHPTNAGSAIRVDSATWTVLVDSCCLSARGGTNEAGAYLRRQTIRNSIIYDCADIGVGTNISWYGFKCYNNTVVNNNIGLSLLSGGNDVNQGVSLKNTVFFGNTTTHSVGGYYVANSGNNASDDETTNPLPGANNVATNITSADFTDTANNDFSIPAGSQLINAGADLSATDNFTNDILGNTRG